MKEIIPVTQPNTLPMLTAEHTAVQYRADGKSEPFTETLLQEHLLEVRLDGVSVLRLACTPVHTAELVLGRLLSEGFISTAQEIASVAISEDCCTAEVMRKEPQKGAAGDTLLTVDTTGNWGARALGDAMKHEPIVWRRQWVEELCRQLECEMPLYGKTHSIHSCYLWCAGKVCFAAEDIGRHNAMDKVIGHILRYGIDARQCAIYTTGRMPVDMVRKAIRAGVPLLAGRKSPTVDGIALAKEYGLTLIGRARGGELTVYAGNLPAEEGDAL